VLLMAMAFGAREAKGMPAVRKLGKLEQGSYR
jgi:hypothetical protein